jgi:hypothetical protein
MTDPVSDRVELQLQRDDIERREKWRDLMWTMPFISFKDDWEVAVTPPFSGAIARFRVRKRGSKSQNAVSVYFDVYDRIGIENQPYWEVHPVNGDCGRCYRDDVEKLLKMIEQGLSELDA